MKMHVSGWDRTVYPRMLIEMKLDNCENNTEYPYDGVNKEIVTDFGRMSPISEIPPFINYKFRLKVGDKTMGGNYMADIFINKDEVMSMFIDIFGDMKINDILKEILDAKTKGKI